MKLTAYLTLFLVFNTALLLSSCQKELDPLSTESNNNPGGGTNPGGGIGNTAAITGEYSFVGLTATTLSTVVVIEQGSELKTVTKSGYITDNNVGTASITATGILFNGVGYSIDTIVNGKTFIDGVLFDDTDFPFSLTLSPTNTTNTYTRITSDSLSVTGDLGVSNPSGISPTGPVGVKLSWAGDTLFLSMKNSFTKDVTQNGVTGTLTGFVSGVAKLKRR